VPVSARARFRSGPTVDGMLTADPRVIATPASCPVSHFAEAAELAYFGAKVLHPATILPAVEHDIPVRILNSRKPGARQRDHGHERARRHAGHGLCLQARRDGGGSSPPAACSWRTAFYGRCLSLRAVPDGGGRGDDVESACR